MQFLFWPLTWGFLLVGIPILVHLINLLRHRRQKWAAMEFLLESYRRNRRWVMLKQWLLLLSRMLAMALLVIMLAKWVTNAQWLSLFGGRTNHHFVLLDDSYSMGAVGGQGETAYTQALRTVAGLLQDIGNQPGDHQVTLIRLSRAELAKQSAAKVDTSGTAKQPEEIQGGAESGREPNSPREEAPTVVVGNIDQAADLLAQTVPRDPSRLIERLNATEPADMACLPETAIELILPTIAGQTGELPIVYLLTDLRRNQFSDAESLRQQFLSLSQQDVPIHLIDCSEPEGANLTVVSMLPEQEVWAASVPLLVRFSVRNSSSQAARNVVAKIRTIEYPEAGVQPQVEQEFSGRVAELPPMVIESIEPGQTVTRQFQVVFPSAGQHVVEVSLPEDALSADNHRWGVIDIQKSQRVLLVDGHVQQLNAFYLESVIKPSETLTTGMTFERVDASYLRDVSSEELAMQNVVALLDVPRLDPAAIDKLIAYAQSGGGILVVLGENTNLEHANESWYRAGNGFLPVMLDRIQETDEGLLGSTEGDQGGPQVVATEHAILQPLLKLSSSPFFALQIRKQILPTPESVKKPGIEVVATGPASQPLIVDRGIGAGRVVAVLTGLSPQWSSWVQDPTFVVLSLRSLGYLGSFQRPPTDAVVGSGIRMQVANTQVLPEGDVLIPGRSCQRMRVLRSIEKSEPQKLAALSIAPKFEDNLDRAVFDGLLRRGVFEVWMTTADGNSLLRNVAHNVAPQEGDLEKIGHQELTGQFPGIDLNVRSSTSFASGLSSRESSQSNLAMAMLILLLIGEQMLAYSASYHPKSRGSTGGRLVPSQSNAISADGRRSSRHNQSFGSTFAREQSSAKAATVESLVSSPFQERN